MGLDGEVDCFLMGSYFAAGFTVTNKFSIETKKTIRRFWNWHNDEFLNDNKRKDLTESCYFT